ncbi:MAG: VOC family protein [Bacteroidetes bacterium]|nr:VOC family protein [Bacteroidota bacterium]
MLTSVCPKIPMRNKAATKQFYVNQLGFAELGDYGDYLMVKKDDVEIHLFEYKDLNPLENYGQVYIRCTDVEQLNDTCMAKGLTYAKYGKLETKPWGQKEFALLDPDHNLLTFGEGV